MLPPGTERHGLFQQNVIIFSKFIFIGLFKFHCFNDLLYFHHRDGFNLTASTFHFGDVLIIFFWLHQK